jgi:hypothetical protein
MYVLRVAASAAKRPASPIVSLRHAVAWLGFDEVANIAFTLALQGKMLDVRGQQHKARRLWRHSSAGPARFESNVVNVARALADFTLLDSTPLARELLVANAAYRDLGLTPEDGEPLFDAAAAINAELDSYLAP